MNFWGEFFGVLAGVCTALFCLPQSVKTIKSKCTEGLSLGSYVIYVISMISWVLYGVYLHSVQMMFFNSVSLIFAVIILVLIIQNRSKK